MDQDQFSHAKILALCVFTLFLFFWTIYSYRNSFHPILDGFRPGYYIWIVHLFCLNFVLFGCLVRPIWTQDPASYIYDNPILCRGWAKIAAFHFVIMLFLVMSFSLVKAQIYFTAHHRYIQRYFKLFVWIGIVPGILYFCMVQGGPKYDVTRHEKSCWQRRPQSSMALPIYYYCLFVYLAHWTLCLLIMTSVCWYYANLLNDSFTSLDLQVFLDRRVIPLLFTATSIYNTIVFGFNWWSTFPGYLFFLLDHLMNNMLMFCTLFGHVDYMEKERKIQAAIRSIELRENSTSTNCSIVNIELGIDNEDYTLSIYWLDVVGENPIKATHELVSKHNLWSAVILDERTCEELERTLIFATVCRSTEDLCTFLQDHSLDHHDELLFDIEDETEGDDYHLSSDRENAGAFE